MTNRLIDRIRHSNTDIEYLPIERLGRSKRGFSLEVSSLTTNDTINYFRNNQLLEVINKIEKINQHTHLENVLYARYLRRVESSKVIETFDQYEDESDVMLTERYETSERTTMHAKLPEIARRLSAKRSSLNSEKFEPSWSKLVNNWRDYMHEVFLLRVEQEKLAIAAYEIEQTKLDWNRMKNNGHFALDQLEVCLRAAESDEIAEKVLNDDLEKTVNKFRKHVAEEKVNKHRFIVPAELLVSRINKRIHSCISVIGLLRVNSARIQLRMQSLDATLHDLDHFHEKMHEIDINFVRTRQVDYLDTYKKLDRQYKIEKSSQSLNLHQLQELKTKLIQQEQEKIDYETKCKLLENRLEKINNEIETIKDENEFIFNENYLLRNRLSDIEKVPSITNYAYVIEQTKTLQHEIDVWTRRINIAEVSFRNVFCYE